MEMVTTVSQIQEKETSLGSLYSLFSLFLGLLVLVCLFAVIVLLFPHSKLVYSAFIFGIFHTPSILVYQHFDP